MVRLRSSLGADTNIGQMGEPATAEGERQSFGVRRLSEYQASLGSPRFVQPDHYPICFSLVTPRAGAHNELLSLLQTEIIARLVERQLIREFRIVAATPPSFVAEDSTLLVFELLVPCTSQITDEEAEQWQDRLGAHVRLVVVSSLDSASPPIHDLDSTWDSKRAHAMLERAMKMGPSRKAPRASKVQWLAACMDRGNALEEQDRSSSKIEAPWLCTLEETTGRRIRISGSMRATLMSDTISRELCQHLPAALQWRSAWRLVYSPRIHGLSMQTFYRRAQDEGPTLLLVQDHCGYVFGGFASATWHVADRYFGDGESFVFKYRKRLPKPVVSLTKQLELAAGQGLGDVETPAAKSAIEQALEAIREWQRKMDAQGEKAEREAACATNRITSPTEALDGLLGVNSAPSTPAPAPKMPPDASAASKGDGPGENDDDASGTNGQGLQVYHWSSKDPFFLFSDQECVAMGGGSAFALYLDKDLVHGGTDACSTFGSDCLSPSKNFIISDLELWAFDDPSEDRRVFKRPPSHLQSTGLSPGH